MLPKYEYEIFLSYSRTGNVRDWVKNHFHPVLRECLVDLLPDEPRIFVDWEQEIGVNWPANFAHSLKRSCYLVAVWSPRYFKSRWCLAEWHSILKREECLGLATEANPRGLVYPVVFSDGVHFPPKARDTQAKIDMCGWAYPYKQFRETNDYLDFHQAVNQMAAQICSNFADAPVWEDNWPIEQPSPSPETPSSLPRI